MLWYLVKCISDLLRYLYTSQKVAKSRQSSFFVLFFIFFLRHAPHLNHHYHYYSKQDANIMKTQETETLINGYCRSNQEMPPGAFSDELQNNFLFHFKQSIKKKVFFEKVIPNMRDLLSWHTKEKGWRIFCLEVFFFFFFNTIKVNNNWKCQRTKWERREKKKSLIWIYYLLILFTKHFNIHPISLGAFMTSQ